MSDVSKATAGQIAQRMLTQLENDAEQWAREASLTSLVATFLSVDDRESQIEHLVKVAFVEGAMRVIMRAMDDGALRL